VEVTRSCSMMIEAIMASICASLAVAPGVPVAADIRA
jgi:hypothetical protein